MIKINKTIKIIGIISVIAYTGNVLALWMLANYNGYTYYSAGEPISYIKYAEWTLGIIGICVSTNYLRELLE